MIHRFAKSNDELNQITYKSILPNFRSIIHQYIENTELKIYILNFE